MWALDWGPINWSIFPTAWIDGPSLAEGAGPDGSSGSWLVSLDFAIPDVRPQAHWQISTGQTVWVYRRG